MTTLPRPRRERSFDYLMEPLPEWIDPVEAWGRQGWAEAERLEAELAQALDLAERLEDHASRGFSLYEAAIAERDGARAQRDRWEASANATHKAASDNAAKASKAEAEVQALRAQVKELDSRQSLLAEALEDAAGELEGISEMHSDDRADYNDVARWAAEKVRSALAKVKA